jgi:hypothetical protein
MGANKSKPNCQIPDNVEHLLDIFSIRGLIKELIKTHAAADKKLEEIASSCEVE